MPDIPLAPAPSPEWQETYDRIITVQPWLARKTDRTRRKGEHYDYLRKYVPELLNTDNALFLHPPGFMGRPLQTGLVIDIGPGPGELLEIMRAYGYDTLGIDAANGRGGMGDEYLEVSRLMTKRQGLNVEYVGFERWVLSNEHTRINGLAVLINSRGSIEQCLSRYMAGEPHDITHCCHKLRWVMTARLEEIVLAAFVNFRRMLRPGGALLINSNGAENAHEFDELLVESAKKVGGLKLTRHVRPTLHKWVKR